MTVKELKTAIYEFLITKTSNVYDKQAVSKIAYPYVVFTLDTSVTDMNEVREDFDLTVDVYDNNQFDTTALDALVSSIDGNGAIVSATGLHRKHYYEAGVLQADFYRNGRNIIEEENENIQHVELNYNVMSYL